MFTNNHNYYNTVGRRLKWVSERVEWYGNARCWEITCVMTAVGIITMPI